MKGRDCPPWESATEKAKPRDQHRHGLEYVVVISRQLEPGRDENLFENVNGEIIDPKSTHGFKHGYELRVWAPISPGDHVFDVRKPNDLEVVEALAQVATWPTDPDVIWEQHKRNMPPSACLYQAETAQRFRARFSRKAANDLKTFLR